MFAGLATVAFGVARGSLAVRHRIYHDKVRPYSKQQDLRRNLHHDIQPVNKPCIASRMLSPERSNSRATLPKHVFIYLFIHSFILFRPTENKTS